MDTKIFKDREHAGKELAEKFSSADLGRTVVFALPRGGVPVAFWIAKAIGAPLDTVVSRKLGSPSNPEFGIGAIAPGDVVMLNDAAIESQGISRSEIDAALVHERTELDRRMVYYRSGEFTKEYEYDTALVVDDGLATGLTAAAALESVRIVQKPHRTIFAAPVCNSDALALVKKAADDIICLMVPDYFLTVGQWYERFTQVSDEEVLYMLHTRHDALTLPSAAGRNSGSKGTRI